MLAVDFSKNKILRNWEVKSLAAKRKNYKNLLQKRTIKLRKNDWLNKFNLEDLELLNSRLLTDLLYGR